MSYAAGLGAGLAAPAGILALSGFIPTVSDWTAELPGRTNLRVFIAHGTRDGVIGVDFARHALHFTVRKAVLRWAAPS